MIIKEIDRTATVAWAPIASNVTLMATGTVSGALDASFSTNTELEIYDLSLGQDGVQKRASISSSARFNKIAWNSSSSQQPMGVIAGGMENGTLEIWSASMLLDGKSNSSILKNNTVHKGPIKGLEFNVASNLLATGATAAEVHLFLTLDFHLGHGEVISTFFNWTEKPQS